MLQLKMREKITGLLVLYFVLAIIAIGSTLFVSWKLEGGAAAINDAGRERMRSYRIAYLLTEQVHRPAPALRQDIEREITLFENSLIELEQGNPERPLFLPKDIEVRRQMQQLGRAWREELKPRVLAILDSTQPAERSRLLAGYRPAMEGFVEGVEALVHLVEKSNAQATNLLRTIQIALVLIAMIGTVLLDYLFSILLVRPVQKLNQGLQSMGKADFGVRLQVSGSDELSELALGFNQMAERLQDLYETLEQRVAEKTRSVEVKNRELGTLYEIASFLNSNQATESMCEGVLGRVMTVIGARGGVVRLIDPKCEQLKVVAAHGVSEAFLAEEAYIAVGSCLCGEITHEGLLVAEEVAVPAAEPVQRACSREGFRALVAIPIRSNQRVLGMLNLFFEAQRILTPAEQRLLESVGLHLGGAIENQWLVARGREMAISEERNLLAQELHDSIAQSLAFLNLQVQMLHDDLSKQRLSEAMAVLEQIREGVQECYDDVRELLVHFRRRLEHPDLESAIASTLEKFQRQSGILCQFRRHGPNLDLAPEHVLQVLNILQEALSNVRKHSTAQQIEVSLEVGAQCCMRISDDGRGFDPQQDAGDSHVGLNIMRERARRFGGILSIASAPGQGTHIELTWNSASIAHRETSPV